MIELAREVRACSVQHGTCLLWPGSLNHGVPQVYRPATPERKRGFLMCRRVVWEARYGPVPEGFVPRAKCREQRCVALHHITLQSLSEFSLERAANMNQQVRGAKIAAGRRRSGKRIKLSLDAAREIRASTDDTAVLAERYGVCVSQIGYVRKHACWREHTPGTSVFAGATP